ncbi:MAG: hypothetical protein MI742_15210 [Desulfobacterales bacterium]|nr:hypothetical protein [Desulfobacterales bacterium]
MSGLRSDGREIFAAKLNRLEFKEREFEVSRKMAEYIDMLESYLMDLEDRVVALETMLGLRGIDLSQFK